MKIIIAVLLLATTVLASPAFARNGSRSAAQDQGNATYQARSRVYQGQTRVYQDGIYEYRSGSWDGRFTPEQQRIIDAISRADRKNSP